MNRDIKNEYFEWLFDLACGKRFGRGISYRNLLTYLHNISFTYLIPRDRNRAEDGIDLRRRFILLTGYDNLYDHVMESLNGPCSILEMMLALAIRCEETIMDDSHIGDRTRHWFWGMITNLGLGGMRDDLFNIELVKERVNIFLSRQYEPNGEGGLFKVRDCDVDLRKVEIWFQLLWYLDTIT